jgi:putative hydrolase of the HAD superfamily
MRDDLNAIVWDFDGVLNRNIVDGRFVWADTIEEDLGIQLDEFEQGIFDENFIHVISGKIDLQIHVQEWLDARDHSFTATALLEYWFAKDDLKDAHTCGLLDQLNALGVQQVIATNNERHRAAYIEETSGFKERVSKIFSSGRIGHAKPDEAFFKHVSDELGFAPQSLLLIDDNAVNVSAAKALGWDAFLFCEESRMELAPYLGL